MIRRLYVAILTMMLVMFGAKSQIPQDQKVASILKSIEQMYVDSVIDSELADEAISAMVNRLDPHSVYLTSSQAQKARRELENEYRGYGFAANIIDDTLVVVRTICGGPADKSGLQPGDKILSIGGVITTGSVIDFLMVEKVMAVDKGFKINFMVVGDNGKAKLVKVKSGNVEQRAISNSFLISDDIAYIKIDIFSKDLGVEFASVLKKLRKQGAEKLILDLRGNKGGYVGSAVDVASEFMYGGTYIVGMQSRNGTVDGRLTNMEIKNPMRGEIVVLVDGNTASSAELLAAAVQDWDRGVIVGRQTYGKGVSQKTIVVSDGSELLLTTHRCISPTGRCIQRDYSCGREKYKAMEICRSRSLRGGEVDTTGVRYKTLRYDRSVWSGSGVTPDVVVERDTTSELFLYELLSRRNVFVHLAAKTYRLTKGNPDVISERSIAERIVLQAKRVGIKCSVDEILTMPLIMSTMRAEIMRLADCRLNVNMFTYMHDKYILMALKILKSGKKVNEINDIL